MNSELRSVRAEQEESHSVVLRSGYRKQCLSLVGLVVVSDLMLPLFPLFLFLEDIL
jgi:hypothetical protein